MSGGIQFAEVFERTGERLRDPVEHFRDLDLYLSDMIPANANALRQALVELLGMGLSHAFIHPVAHGLAAMHAARRFDYVSGSKLGVLGVVTGLEAASVIDAERISRLRDLIEKTYSALWDCELERLKRRRRARA